MSQDLLASVPCRLLAYVPYDPLCDLQGPLSCLPWRVPRIPSGLFPTCSVSWSPGSAVCCWRCFLDSWLILSPSRLLWLPRFCQGPPHPFMPRPESGCHLGHLPSLHPTNLQPRTRRHTVSPLSSLSCPLLAAAMSLFVVLGLSSSST